MQKLAFTLLLLSVGFSLQAEIYKSVDEEGNVIFSDKETVGSEEIPMHMPTAVPMPKLEKKEAVEEEEPTSYTSLKISQPSTNDTIRNNAGAITVALELEPELDVEAGHKIFVYVNGKPVVEGSTGLTHALTNISRGSVGIKAKVKDEKDKTLISSNKVIVHLKRESALQKKSQRSKAGPLDPAGNPIIPDPVKPGPLDPFGNPIQPGPQTPAFKPGPQNPNFRPGPIVPANP